MREGHRPRNPWLRAKVLTVHASERHVSGRSRVAKLDFPQIGRQIKSRLREHEHPAALHTLRSWQNRSHCDITPAMPRRYAIGSIGRNQSNININVFPTARRPRLLCHCQRRRRGRQTAWGPTCFPLTAQKPRQVKSTGI